MIVFLEMSSCGLGKQIRFIVQFEHCFLRQYYRIHLQGIKSSWCLPGISVNSKFIVGFGFNTPWRCLDAPKDGVVKSFISSLVFVLRRKICIFLHSSYHSNIVNLRNDNRFHLHKILCKFQ